MSSIFNMYISEAYYSDIIESCLNEVQNFNYITESSEDANKTKLNEKIKESIRKALNALKELIQKVLTKLQELFGKLRKLKAPKDDDLDFKCEIWEFDDEYTKKLDKVWSFPFDKFKYSCDARSSDEAERVKADNYKLVDDLGDFTGYSNHTKKVDLNDSSTSINAIQITYNKYLNDIKNILNKFNGYKSDLIKISELADKQGRANMGNSFNSDYKNAPSVTYIMHDINICNKFITKLLQITNAVSYVLSHNANEIAKV